MIKVTGCRPLNRAFTLMEILIALLVSGVLFSMFYSIFLGGWMNFEINNERVLIQTQALRAMESLEEDVFESTGSSLVDGAGRSVQLQYPQTDALDQASEKAGTQPSAAGSAEVVERPLKGKDPFPFTRVTYSIVDGDLLRQADDHTPLPVTQGGYIADASRFFVDDKKSLRCRLHFTSTNAFEHVVDYKIYNVFQARN